MGEPLDANMVVVAACNPCRTQATTKGACLLENDLGREWVSYNTQSQNNRMPLHFSNSRCHALFQASGHYQVVALPTSLINIKWAFGKFVGNLFLSYIVSSTSSHTFMPCLATQVRSLPIKRKSSFFVD
jgi:hypothetical protein